MKLTLQTTLPDLSPRSILQAFQQAADAHSREMGVGFQEIRKQGLLWVVTRIRYEILRCPGAGEPLELQTWPLPASRLGFERNYIIMDREGEPLIRGTSLWVVMDAETRRLALCPELYPEGNYSTEQVFPDRARRLRPFEGELACTVIPGEEHIDRNGHVNNSHYPAFAAKALGNPPVRSLQIDYIREVLKDQPLLLYTRQEGDTRQVMGKTEAGETAFICEMK